MAALVGKAVLKLKGGMKRRKSKLAGRREVDEMERGGTRGKLEKRNVRG